MTDTDDLYLFFLSAKQLTDGLGLRLNGAGRSFLHKDVTILSVLESKKNEVDGFFQRHDETCHLRLGQSNGISVADLINPQWYHRTARTHHIAVTRTANLGLARIAALGNGYFLFDGLADTHCIDGISRLVGGKADNGTHAGFNGCRQHVVCADYIGTHRLHRKKLATRNLLQCGGMENIVHSRHRVLARLQIAHVTDKELYLVSHIRILRLILVAHVVLFLLVAREYTYFSDVGTQKTV